MVTDAPSDPTSGRTDPASGNAKRPNTGSTPPMADLSGRSEPVPGPLTKPAPVIRPPRRRTRWLIPVIIIVVLAAAAGTAVIWQMSQSGLG